MDKEDGAFIVLSNGEKLRCLVDKLFVTESINDGADFIEAFVFHDTYSAEAIIALKHIVRIEFTKGAKI